MFSCLTIPRGIMHENRHRLSSPLGLLIAVLGFVGTSAAACEGRLIDSAAVLASPVCVPVDAQRIVVLDATYSLGMGLELDLPIVGAPLFDMSDAVLKSGAQAHGVTDIGAMTAPSVEAVIALQPDLIIGGALAEAYLPMLTQLAPTVLIADPDWKAYYRLIGQITGRGDAVEAGFAAYDARVAAMRDSLPDTVVSILRITNWDFQVYLDGPNAYGPFDVLRDLGVRRSTYETTTDTQAMKRPDWEELAALDGDQLWYIVGGANDSDTSGRHEEVITNPLWQFLPGVTAGEVHQLDPGIWMEFSGLGSAMRVLDDAERLLFNQP